MFSPQRAYAQEHGLLQPDHRQFQWRENGLAERNTTDENFVFNNIIMDTSGDGILVQSAGTNNYFSGNILSNNRRDMTLDPAGVADFFNKPVLDSPVP